MVKAKVGSIVLGGLAGYLILSKGIGAVERCVRNVCTARQWKSYYKYGKEQNMVPPGYSVHTVNDGDTTREYAKNPHDLEKKDASQGAKSSVLAESVVKAILDAFGVKTGENGPSEGNNETSEGENMGTDEEAKDICPHDCVNCIIRDKDCPHMEQRPNGGVITQWDEDTPVAGRYPWTKEGMTQCFWHLETMPDREDIPGEEYDGNEDSEELTPEEYAEMDRKEDAEIEAIGMDDILVNGADPGDPDGLNKPQEE